MPAPKLYMSSKDIAAYLGVCRRTAQNLMAMFEYNGKTVMNMRYKRVAVRIFADYLSEIEHSDRKEKYQEIKDWIKMNESLNESP